MDWPAAVKLPYPLHRTKATLDWPAKGGLAARWP